MKAHECISFHFFPLFSGFFHSDKHQSVCEACDCHPVGAAGQVCDADTGQCTCADSTLAGRKCDQCQELYFGFNPIMGRLVVHSDSLPRDENHTVEAKC